MTGTPNAILLSRALHALQSAKLEILDGRPLEAFDSIERAVMNLEKVEGL